MSFELQLLLLLAIIITICKVAGHISYRYFRQPVVFGEILSGLLLGPTVLNIFGWSLFTHNADNLHTMVAMLAKIGILLLMFVAGLETDMVLMRKVGKTAFWTALTGVALPFIGGFVVARLFGIPLPAAVFLGVVLTATSVSISAQTLLELGQLGSKQGATILGAAVIDDVIGIIMLALVVAFAVPSLISAKVINSTTPLVDRLSITISQQWGLAHVALIRVLLIMLLMLVFFAVVLLGGRLLKYILKLAAKMHARHMVLTTALVIMFLLAIGAEYFGQVAAITGAYLAGIYLARTPFHKEIEEGIHPFTYAVFVPIFFVSIGLNVNVRDLGSGVLFSIVIVLIAVISKVAGCGIAARISGFSTREALQVGVGMISRGEVGLIVAQIGREKGLLDQTTYAAMVLMVLVSTVITPLLLRLSFPRVSDSIENSTLE